MCNLAGISVQVNMLIMLKVSVPVLTVILWIALSLYEVYMPT